MAARDKDHRMELHPTMWGKRTDDHQPLGRRVADESRTPNASREAEDQEIQVAIQAVTMMTTTMMTMAGMAIVTSLVAIAPRTLRRMVESWQQRWGTCYDRLCPKRKGLSQCGLVKERRP